MPIIDVQLVVPGTQSVPSGLAQAVADALGHLWESPAGRIWVRASALPQADYAENGTSLAPDELPVFVTLLLAELPEREDRARHAVDATTAVARAVGREPSSVHIEYAAPGRGRVAFGGLLAN